MNEKRMMSLTRKSHGMSVTRVISRRVTTRGCNTRQYSPVLAVQSSSVHWVTLVCSQNRQWFFIVNIILILLTTLSR